LDDLEARHDLVVVVGDLYETWQGRRFGDTRSAMAEIRSTYPRLCGRLSSAPYKLVSGNHDASVEAQEHGTRHLEVAVDGVRILFTHGHQWDPPVKRTRPLAYSFAWSTGTLNRLQGPVVARFKGVRDAFERRYLYNKAVPEVLDGAARTRCPYLGGAIRLLEARPELDVVVCGHTHVPARCDTAHGTYLNCGSLAGGRWSWVELDTRRRMWRIEQRR
jgi:predicted phosphodiesterase